MSADGMDRRLSLRALGGVVLFALAIRVICLIQTTNVPTARHLVGDAAGYVDWARKIAGGDWLGSASFYQAPLYPYVLGVLFWFAGDSTSLIRVVQAVWGAAACGLLAWFVARTFGRREGLLAGMLLACFGPAVFYDGIVQKASLSNVLICALLAAIACARSAGLATLVVLGVVSSLLSLTRENAAVWQMLLAAWVLTTSARSESTQTAMPGPSLRCRAGRTAAYLLGAAVVLIPVGVRNAHVGGEFSLTTFQAGSNFYIGNHRGADGRYVPLVRGHETPAFERRDAIELAQHEAGRDLSPREVSRFWMSKAWKEIRGDLGSWLGLLSQKLLLTWNRYEIADVESLVLYRQSSWLLDTICRVSHFGVIAPLAVVGVWATRRRWRELWLLHGMIVSMTAAVAAFYVLGRYRFPLVPLLVCFAAAGCVSLWDAWRERRRNWVTGVIFAGLAAVVVNRPIQDEARLDALAVMNAGAALAQAGDLDAATDCFARAVAAHPGSAEAHYNLAQALALRGEFVRAVGHYESARLLNPDLDELDFNFGVSLERVGRNGDALSAFRRALQRNPNDDEARSAVRRLSVTESP